MTHRDPIPADTVIDIAPADPLELREDKRSGFGYMMYLPVPAAPIDEALPELSNFSNFLEMPAIISELEDQRAVLVTGEPGSGKSHLVRDLQIGSVVSNIPTFRLTMQLNGAKREGVANIRPLLDEFIDKVEGTGGLVILDNLDYLGYNGHSRRREASAEYAQSAFEMTEELVNNPDLVVLATAHDPEWREGKWTWEDSRIDGPAATALELFPVGLRFEGEVALEGLIHLLHERNSKHQGEQKESAFTIGQAAKAIEMLNSHGLAKFFYANHLNLDRFLEDPQAAIAEIDAGRDQRRGKAS